MERSKQSRTTSPVGDTTSPLGVAVLQSTGSTGFYAIICFYNQNLKAFNTGSTI